MPRLPGTSLKRLTRPNMFFYPPSNFSSQNLSLWFPTQAIFYFFRRDFTLNCQRRPKTNQALPQVMGELGVGDHCYLPLLFAPLSSELPPTNPSILTGTYVPKFANWAPIRGHIIRSKKDGNTRIRRHPGQDPSP